MPMNNDARTKWNKENYTQVKIFADPQLAAEFKAACAANNISIAKVLSKAMTDYCNRPTIKTQNTNTETETEATPDYSTREKRRKALKEYITQIESIKNAEEIYMENIPENLRGSQRYENAEQTIAAIEDGLESLSEAFA